MTSPFIAQLKNSYWAWRSEIRRRARIAVADIVELAGPVLHKIRMARSFTRNVLLLMRARYFPRTGQPVVIALTEHMGDIVAAQPIAHYLRGRHPEANLIWVVRRPFVKLVQSFGEVDTVIGVECINEWAWLRDAKVVQLHYDLHVNRRVCPICKNEIVRETGNPDIDTVNYFSYGNLLAVMCQNAGIPILDSSPRLVLSGEAPAAVDALGLPEEFIAIHVSSNEVARDWSVDKWKELLQWIIDNTSMAVVEVGLKAGVHASSPRFLDLCGKLSILETAEVLRRAKVFVGVDSGPAHLAHAVATPAVIMKGAYRIFERYDSFSGEYSNGRLATIINAIGPAINVTVDDVIVALKQRLSVATSTDASHRIADERPVLDDKSPVSLLSN